MPEEVHKQWDLLLHLDRKRTAARPKPEDQEDVEVPAAAPAAADQERDKEKHEKLYAAAKTIAEIGAEPDPKITEAIKVLEAKVAGSSGQNDFSTNDEENVRGKVQGAPHQAAGQKEVSRRVQRQNGHFQKAA